MRGERWETNLMATKIASRTRLLVYSAYNDVVFGLVWFSFFVVPGLFSSVFLGTFLFYSGRLVVGKSSCCLYETVLMSKSCVPRSKYSTCNVPLRPNLFCLFCSYLLFFLVCFFFFTPILCLFLSDVQTMIFDSLESGKKVF